MFERRCPKCNKTLTYTRKRTMDEFERRNSLCHSCAMKNASESIKKAMKRPEVRTKVIEAAKKNWKNPKYRAKLSGKNHSSWIPRNKIYENWRLYKTEVYRITRQQLKSNFPLPNFDKRGRAGIKGAYQVDHMISIKEGFDRKIPPEKIANIKNLQMLTWEDNEKKRTRSVF